MEKVNSEVNEWKNSNVQIFWGEIAPCDHLVQIYENDKIFIGTLEGFVGSGFLSGDNVVIIATAIHLKELNRRLEKQGFDINDLTASGQYIPLNANEELSGFMVNNWTDEKLFNDFVTNLIIRAKKITEKFAFLENWLPYFGNKETAVQRSNSRIFGISLFIQIHLLFSAPIRKSGLHRMPMTLLPQSAKHILLSLMDKHGLIQRFITKQFNCRDVYLLRPLFYI